MSWYLLPPIDHSVVGSMPATGPDETTGTERPGHLARLPSSASRAGASNERTRKVSTRMSTDITAGSSRNDRTGISATRAKLAARDSPAARIARDARGAALAIASRIGRLSPSAQILPTIRTL